MKIATMATGGIGGFLAVKLAEQGQELVMIARGRHLDAIRSNGLVLETASDKTVCRPALATDDPAEAGPVDAIIFGVKGDDLPSAAKAINPMVGSDTVVIPFLNGVEASDRLCEFIPEKNVANGVAYVSTTISEPGVIKQTGAFNRFIFGERDNSDSERLSELRDAITSAGVEAPATDDIKLAVWQKFLLFSAMSGVTAAARCRFKEIRDIEPLGELFRGVVAETAALARANGIAIADDAEIGIWEQALLMPDEMRASTAIDLENGRPLEVEWVTGAVKRLSAVAGLDAPINNTIYALLSPYRHGSG